MINRLCGGDVLDVAETRRDGKGRHTTVRRELIVVPSGGLTVDTPGLRELPPGTFFDLSVLHIVTTATLARLARRRSL